MGQNLGWCVVLVGVCASFVCSVEFGWVEVCSARECDGVVCQICVLVLGGGWVRGQRKRCRSLCIWARRSVERLAVSVLSRWWCCLSVERAWARSL